MTKYGNLGIILIWMNLQIVSDTTAKWFQGGNAMLVVVAESGQGTYRPVVPFPPTAPLSLLLNLAVVTSHPFAELAGPSLVLYPPPPCILYLFPHFLPIHTLAMILYIISPLPHKHSKQPHRCLMFATQR